MEKFDIKTFIHEYNSGDLCGLEYLEKTLITEYKNKSRELFIKGKDTYNVYDYIISLFYATMQLNTSEIIYETTNFGKSFNSDLYFNTKTLLFTEIGKLEKIDLEHYIEEYWNI